MQRGDMTGKERLWTAMRLEQPDRVPVVPLLTPEPAAHLAGFTMAQVSNSYQTAMEACLSTFDSYGGWDSMHGGPVLPIQLQATGTHPVKMRIPGRSLPDDYIFQVLEEEVMQPEDYATICEMGMDRFYQEDYLWRITEMDRGEVDGTLQELVAMWPVMGRALKDRGVAPFTVANDNHPFFRLSLMRSMVPFTQDLYYDPEPVERALTLMTDELIQKQLRIVKATGVNTLLLVEERASAYYYPLRVFERFWWPYTQRIIDALWSEGVVTVLHLDSCWDKNLPYFKRLPRGSAVIELDSTTNIFLAKEMLAGHLCLHGDVPASLLSLGEPDEVEAYCRSLIDGVGRDGGFILGTGCAAPPDCKPENFRAMIETGRNYRPPG